MDSKKINILSSYKDTKERFYGDIFVGREYKEAKDKKGTVIDLGACGGMFSFYIYDNASKIYAIEPYSKHFDELSNNVKGFKKIKPFRLAIAGSNGERKLYIKGRGGHSIVNKGKDFEMVKAMTLATFIKKNKIKFVDILKIDVESAEIEIFSAPDFKEVADKIGFIIGEFHSGNNNIGKLLDKYGYKTKIRGKIFIARK